VALTLDPAFAGVTSLFVLQAPQPSRVATENGRLLALADRQPRHVRQVRINKLRKC
jgi:hypothetical protein